ncbi:MAG TPA: M1 family aminopeptidase, partial [Candidatus Binatia bacterium]|nr:M1 family aminopeptidase [Candidatus Binatia bacterium]
VFDLFYDTTAAEQVEGGRADRADDGTLYYDVWTSFSVEDRQSNSGRHNIISPTMPGGSAPHEDPVNVREYTIEAGVKPPRLLEADVKMLIETKRPLRCLEFELSRYLRIQKVEADGKPVEFIQNPAVEGTQLARRGNDLVAVVLPEPTIPGQAVSLRFMYAGDVIEESGKGLLYVGARGTWYPNRGFGNASFDLTFHYPPGWTLLATGKPTPFSAPPAADQQTSRWVSARPIPVAGFNLGKYVRGAALAGDIPVETYATQVVEKDFPQAAPPPPEVDPTPSLHQIPPLSLSLSTPSPARNATAIAEAAARAIRFYSERFGPFPYTQLDLTQLPGPESQGWPGLVFLSSYAFLTSKEEDDLHMKPAGKLIDELIPAHETAHQWWGDLITWTTYRDQWFSEGLANYSSLMMLQEKNPAGFHVVMERYRDELASKNKDGSELKDAGPVTLGGRLLSSKFPAGYEAISYGRGTWLFHMLHSMLVDAATEEARKKNPSRAAAEDPFVRGLRKLRERYAGKSITTNELLAVFAEELPPSLRYEGKSSLDWFLESWINGTALPRLQLHDTKLIPKANGVMATGTIRQKDAPEDLITSVPIYAELPGKSLVLVGRVFADGAETSFRLNAPVGTRKLVLDPNQTVLTAPN